MSYSYDKRREAPVGRKDQQPSGRAPMGTLRPDASNSAQIAMLGHHDAPGGAKELKAAMDAKAASLIGGRSGALDRFGPDYKNARAEAEADRIGSRFIGATGVKDLVSRMSSALGADFSSVRFHTGADATAMADSADANAFTTGRDIYLGGPFNAGVAAHEMVHTIQQGAVESSAPVMSAPAGSVQYDYKPRSKFKNNPKHWLEKMHEKAMDDIIEHRDDYDNMSLGRRALWSIRNPLARIRGRRSVGQSNERYQKRKQQREAEARYVANATNPARGKQWTDEELGDAMKPQTVPDSDAYEPGGFGEFVESGAEKLDKVNSDLGTGTGLSWSGTPLEATGVGDAGVKIAHYMDHYKKTGVRLKSDDLKGLSGMDYVNGVAGGLAFMGDLASFGSDAMEAHKQRMQGNHAAAVGSSFNSVADLAAMGGDVLSMIPVGPMGVIGSGVSGVANTIKAGVSFGSAIGNTHTQRMMKKRRDKYKAQEDAALQMSPAQVNALSADDKKERRYKITRSRTAEQARKAARIRKHEDIVSGVSSSVKAAANYTAMGLGAAALAGSFGVLDPVSGVVNSIGTAAGAITEGVGGRVVKSQKRAMRRETVDDELGLEKKIEALMNGKQEMCERFGITAADAKQLSYSSAKHIILKSMGFASGKRKEAFNQITMNRARALAEKANTYDPNDESVGKEEREMMREMFLGTDSHGKYNVTAIAEKLGLEEMEDSNPFKKYARSNASQQAATNPQAATGGAQAQGQPARPAVVRPVPPASVRAAAGQTTQSARPAVVRPVPPASVRAAAGQTAQPARTPVVRPVPPASVRAAAGQNTQGQPGTPPPVPPRPEFLRRRTSNP